MYTCVLEKCFENVDRILSRERAEESATLYNRGVPYQYFKPQAIKPDRSKWTLPRNERLHDCIPQCVQRVKPKSVGTNLFVKDHPQELLLREVATDEGRDNAISKQ